MGSGIPARQKGKERGEEMHQDFIAGLQAEIQRHLEEPLDLDTLAAKTNYSKYHLNHIFFRETGMTLHQYIRRLRLQRAAIKLAGTNEPICEIALAACYSSQQAFTTAFCKEFHCTPLAYRKKYGGAARCSCLGYPFEGGMAA